MDISAKCLESDLILTDVTTVRPLNDEKKFASIMHQLELDLGKSPEDQP